MGKVLMTLSTTYLAPCRNLQLGYISLISHFVSWYDCCSHQIAEQGSQFIDDLMAAFFPLVRALPKPLYCLSTVFTVEDNYLR